MGLVVRGLNEKELWEGLWRRINHSEPIPIPQLLILEKNGLRENQLSSPQYKSLLLADDVPVFDRQWGVAERPLCWSTYFWDKPGDGTIKHHNCTICGTLLRVTLLLIRKSFVNSQLLTPPCFAPLCNGF